MKSNIQIAVFFPILLVVMLYLGVFSLVVPLQYVLAQVVTIPPFDGTWPFSGTVGGNRGCLDAVKDMQGANGHGYNDGIPRNLAADQRNFYQPAYQACWICPAHTTCQSPSGFRVTGMSLDRNTRPNVSKVIYRGSCPININVPMTITTVGFGPVTWRGNGHEWHAQQVFTSPGTHSFLQPIPITHSGQEVIKIQYPTQMAIYGTIICTNK
jgi:hypothetical protein